MKGRYRKESLRLLGVQAQDCLSLGERMALKSLTEAMDHGVTFRSSEDAEKFVRYKLNELLIIVIFIILWAVAVVLGAVAWGMMNCMDGYSEGVRSFGKVCELIIGKEVIVW